MSERLTDDELLAIYNNMTLQWQSGDLAQWAKVAVMRAAIDADRAKAGLVAERADAERYRWWRLWFQRRGTRLEIDPLDGIGRRLNDHSIDVATDFLIGEESRALTTQPPAAQQPDGSTR